MYGEQLRKTSDTDLGPLHVHTRDYTHKRSGAGEKKHAAFLQNAGLPLNGWLMKRLIPTKPPVIPK